MLSQVGPKLASSGPSWLKLAPRRPMWVRVGLKLASQNPKTVQIEPKSIQKFRREASRSQRLKKVVLLQDVVPRATWRRSKANLTPKSAQNVVPRPAGGQLGPTWGPFGANLGLTWASMGQHEPTWANYSQSNKTCKKRVKTLVFSMVLLNSAWSAKCKTCT